MAPLTTAQRRAAGKRGQANQRYIAELLEKCGAKVYRIGTTRRRGDYQGTMQTPGVADIVAFLPWPPRGVVTLAKSTADGVHVRSRYGVWIEGKAGSGRLTAAQAEFRDMCEATLWLHWTGDLDAVIAKLVDGGWLKPETIPHYRLPPSAKPVD